MRHSGLRSAAFATLLAALALPVAGQNKGRDKPPRGDQSFLVFEAFGGRWADAEKAKRNKDDDLLCWAAAAANALTWTGWAQVAGLKDEDAVFEYFQAHWTNHGGASPRRAWHWFLKGTDPVDKGARVDVPGGGFSPAADLGEETWKNTPGALYRGLGSKMIARKPLALKSLLDDGYGVAIQIVRPQENGKRDSHVVSLWGYTYNRDEPFRGVYITDSDDDKKSRSSRKAKNRLRHYGVVFKDGSWWFQAATDYEGWRILAAYGLARMPTESKRTAR